jgi:Protein of unknown function (DUF2510)
MVERPTTNTGDEGKAQPAAGWYGDPWKAGGWRYWDGVAWTSSNDLVAPSVAQPTAPGWYADPGVWRGQRYWTGSTWTKRRSAGPPRLLVAVLVILTVQGCAVALSNAPQCQVGGGSIPSSTSFGTTVLLWLMGVGGAILVAVVWTRNRWTPTWPPWAMAVGAAILPVVGWVFAAGSCGL